MLSCHSKKRDKYGLPIVATLRRIGFADESSEKDNEMMTTWNTDHKKLIFFAEKSTETYRKNRFHINVVDATPASSLLLDHSISCRSHH